MFYPSVCFLLLHKNRKLPEKVGLCWSSFNGGTTNAFLRGHLPIHQLHCKPAIMKILNYYISCHFYTQPLSVQTVQLMFCSFSVLLSKILSLGFLTLFFVCLLYPFGFSHSVFPEHLTSLEEKIEYLKRNNSWLRFPHIKFSQKPDNSIYNSLYT